MLPFRAHLGQTLIFSASGALLLFLVLPLFVLLARAIEADLLQQLTQPTVTQALRLSLVTSSLSMLITAALGTPLAYSLARHKVPARSVIETLLDLPIVLPPAVAGLALLLTFGRRGFLGPVLETLDLSLPFTTTAVIMAETFVAAPFFIRSAQVGFANVSHQLEESASDLGANNWQVFRRVTLPLAGTALLSGLILSWARALGEFGATILFAGSFSGRTQTMPLAIYHALESDLGSAVALAAILILISFFFLALLRLITHGRIGHPML
ncbi:sulfate transport system permease protein [Thermoflexales bacterium]|nr:sulfate transport system permease protein [Thermoflexales bacterium]